MNKNQFALIFTLITLIIAINYFSFINKGKKEPIILETNFVNSEFDVNPTFSQITFSGPEPNFISKLPLLEIEIKDNDSFYTILDQYCQIYDHDDIYHHGNKCDYSAYSAGFLPQITMHNHSSSNNKIDPSMITSASNSFLQNFINPSSLSMFPTSINYYSGEEAFVPSNINDANLARINYNYTYQNIPIFPKDATSDLTNLLINNQNQIVLVNFYTPQILSFAQEPEYQLLSISSALENITAQKAYLLSFSEDQDYLSADYNPVSDFNLNLFTSTNLNQVKLEYRLNQEKNLAIPVYHFSGLGTDLNHNQLDIHIITPAINFTLAQ